MQRKKKKNNHQTTPTQISKSSVQHFGSSRIKAAVLHTFTLQKKCKYALSHFSSHKALICAKAGQSSHSQQLFWILFFLPHAMIDPQDKFLECYHSFAPRQNDSFTHRLFLNAHHFNTWRCCKDLCLFLCNSFVSEFYRPHLHLQGYWRVMLKSGC